MDRKLIDMNPLCSLLKPENILLGIGASSKKRIFEQAAQTLSLLYGLEKKEVFDALIARERLGSTYLDHGVALPHCRLANLKEPRALYLRLHGSLPTGTDNSQEVHEFFFLLAPEDAASEHLQLLAAAAELFSDDAMREKLEKATTSENFYENLLEWCEAKKDTN